MRAVRNRIFFRPVKETFHEFLIYHLVQVLGKDWYNYERRLPANRQHQIMRWLEEFDDWRRQNRLPENQVQGGWRLRPSGDAESLLTLAHDVYQVAHCTQPPEPLFQRLKSRDHYQGARYEVAVASIFARIGSELEYLPDDVPTKHGEFIARHPAFGVVAMVEAKSRHRPGVLHQQGTPDLETALQGDVKTLFDRALEKSPGDMAFVVFIDLNAPPTPGVSPLDKPWLDPAQRMLEKYGSPNPEAPDSFSALFLTNFSFHYAGAGAAPPAEYVSVFSQYPTHRLHPDFLGLLNAAVHHYSDIPGGPPLADEGA